MFYLIDAKAQPNGDNLLHSVLCGTLPEPQDRVSLGDFPNCRSAMSPARMKYKTANGCPNCSGDCHTKK